MPNNQEVLNKMFNTFVDKVAETSSTRKYFT